MKRKNVEWSLEFGRKGIKLTAGPPVDRSAATRHILDNTKRGCYNLSIDDRCAADHRYQALRRHCSYGVNELSQETIARILSIEQEASGIYAETQRQAARLIEAAKESASVLRERTLAETHKEAEQILATGRGEAEAERARTMAQAKAEAQCMENLAAQHFERALNFVLDQIVGRE